MRILSILFILFLNKSFAQIDSSSNRNRSVDTIETYVGIRITDGPDGYFVNDKRVDKRTYEGYKRVMDNEDNCKPCWLKEYTVEGEFVSEGLYYGGECRVGEFIEYYSAGRKKLVGLYKQITPGTKDYPCSVKDGKWIYYDRSGKIFKTEFYKEGILVN